ncbi:PfkB family carbohydrate kinase [Paenibacillus riograndensis]|uniref:Ribokinase family Sugar kinase n=2 Tax=Paenibacillus riograndensis TaxID=483937 RepID=A0A0E4HBS5_9BACL|nr:PfkB family carbohydrate kinase [Paenibacillus riograndensis]CQR56985.1 ribokinase family Sugar kinase [Paenibacillus riograndensis SBR5]
MVKVIGIGDNVGDIYLDSYEMFPGGQALNFSVYAKRLGAESAYIGVFGDDAVARHIAGTLDEVGVDRSHCRHVQGENGYALVELVDGDRVFLGSNRGGVLKDKPIILDSRDESYIRQFDLVHTSNNSYFNEQLSKVHKLGVAISYDFSKSWSNWRDVEQIAPHLDYGFLSCSSDMTDEEAGETCRKVHALGCRSVVATLGSRGAWFYDGELRLFQASQYVDPVDTLGAGDSFAAAFLVDYLRQNKLDQGLMNTSTHDREEACRQALASAAAFAAQSCLERGAFGYGKKYQHPLPKRPRTNKSS